jgi:hypothetical protein
MIWIGNFFKRRIMQEMERNEKKGKQRTNSEQK